MVVRNLSLIKTVDSGETKSAVSDQIHFYHEALVDRLGKPSKVESTKKDGRTIGMSISYKPFPDFKPIRFVFDPSHNAGQQDGWTVDICFPIWVISSYHKGPDIQWTSKKIELRLDDGPDSLTETAYWQYQAYLKKDNLVEDSISKTRAEYLREDIPKLSSLDGTNLIERYRIKNLFLINYLHNLFKEKSNSISDEDLIRKIPVFDPNNFDVLESDYKDLGNYFVTKHSKLAYKEARSTVPAERFTQFILATRTKMKEFLTPEQIEDIFKQLEI